MQSRVEGRRDRSRRKLLFIAAGELFCKAVGGGRFPKRSGGLFLRAAGEGVCIPRKSGALQAGSGK